MQLLPQGSLGYALREFSVTSISGGYKVNRYWALAWFLEVISRSLRARLAVVANKQIQLQIYRHSNCKQISECRCCTSGLKPARAFTSEYQRLAKSALLLDKKR